MFIKSKFCLNAGSCIGTYSQNTGTGNDEGTPGGCEGAVKGGGAGLGN